MFIGHLPAGYLLTKALTRGPLPLPKGLMAMGLVASVLPDLDLIWFYLVDARQTVHHAYLFHMPLFWVALAAGIWGLGRLLRWRHAGLFAAVALANLLLHMGLDTIAGGIGWLRPFSEVETTLVQVPARYHWWVWNFVLHWSFALEILVVAAAGMVFWRERRFCALTPETAL